MAPEKVYISGNEIFVDSYRLARKIYDQGWKPDFVVGIWRGGTPIGIAVEEFMRVQECPIKFHTAIKVQGSCTHTRAACLLHAHP